jgi:hypothetical protein
MTGLFMDIDPKETKLWQSAFADKHCSTVTQSKARSKLITARDELDTEGLSGILCFGP